MIHFCRKAGDWQADICICLIEIPVNVSFIFNLLRLPNSSTNCFLFKPTLQFSASHPEGKKKKGNKYYNLP